MSETRPAGADDQPKSIVLVPEGDTPYKGDPFGAEKEASRMADGYFGVGSESSNKGPELGTKARGDGDTHKDGPSNKNVRVWDMQDGKYKTVPEDKIDPSRHALDGDIGGGSVGVGVETENEEKITKLQFLELVTNARISNNDANVDPEKKTKKNEARKQLGDEGLKLNVQYITAGDIRGSDELARRARKERNSQINKLMIAIEKGAITEEQRSVLVGESIKLKQEMLDDWGVVVEIRVSDRPEPEAGVDPVITEMRRDSANEEKIFAEYVRNNEKRLFGFLIREYNNVDFDPARGGLTNIVELRTVIEGMGLDVTSLGDDYNKIFTLARNVFLSEVLTPKSFAEISGQSNSLQDKENTSEETDIQGRDRLRGVIAKHSREVIVKRGWMKRFTGDYEKMSGDLDKFLQEHYNKTEKRIKKGSDLLLKVFKDRYGGEFDLRIDEIEKTKVADSVESRELIDSVCTVRNLARKLDKASSLESNEVKNALVGIDGSLKVMVNLEHNKRPGIKIIPEMVVEIMTEAARIADADRAKGVDIGSDTVRNAVLNGLSGTVLNEDEKKMYFEMARDLIRVTGMDASLVVPRDGGDPAKCARGDGFIVGAINFEDKTRKKYIKDKALLVNNLNFGLLPFFRKIDGVGGASCEGMSANEIVNAVNNRFEGTAYTAWINSFEGIVNLQKGEEDFIKNPSIKGFVETVIPLYLKAKIDDEKIKIRFSDVIKGMVVNRFTDYVGISTYLSTYLVREDGSFNNLGIFKDSKDAKEYFAKNSRGVSLAKYDGRQEDLSGRSLGRKISNFLTFKGWRE